MADKPRFVHDCDDCTFIGYHDVEGEPPMDLYAHWGEGEKTWKKTVVARWGDRKDLDCASGIDRVPEVPALQEALARGLAQEIIPADYDKEG